MIDVAYILAGGFGSRLAPWEAPKCLLPINGVPILARLLEHLDASRVPHAVACVGYRARDVVEHLARAKLKMSVETDDAGDAPMGERLLRARKQCPRSRTLICYGDEMANVDLRALNAKHASEERAITFTAYHQRLPFGVVRDDDRISEEETVLVNIGFVLVDDRGWEYLHPEDGVSHWINRAPKEQVSLYVHTGRRVTVNTVADLKIAEAVWR